MKLSRPLIVTIEDAEFHFQNPGLRAWAEYVDLDGKKLEDQATVILSRITAIRGVLGENGEELSLEEFLKTEIPVWVLIALKREYVTTLTNLAHGKVGAEEKKVPTTASSSSSDSDSSTQH